ncbi:hypothetical protein Aca07nite_31330 [Actinoplanes capillaceus]|uniref:Uncharacterized protein n=1 Tax=Actinoplanes campanulatus TaxID=113559 RepID=A0ABQ3WHZ9_9ACTN|nr:hypothetical protein Aca07nite_31330 [Actinoplanes capillaceus]
MHHAAHDRLARELSEARAQIEWYEQSTAAMHADLSHADGTRALAGAPRDGHGSAGRRGPYRNRR